MTVDATATVATSLTVVGGATILTDAQIADDGNFTADIEGDITLDANGGEITLSDNNSETGKVIVDMDNTNIKHQYDASNYVTTTLASTGSVTRATVGAGTTDSDYTLDVDGELVLDAADAAGVIMKINGTSQVSVIDGVIKPTSNNNIDLGTSDNQFKNVYITGVGTFASLDISGNIDVDGTTNLDNTDIDGTLAVDGATISLDATTSFNIDNTNTTNGVTINTATSGGPISIGHSTSETTVNDNLNVTGALLYNSKIVSTKSDGTTLAASESGSVILQSTNSATITLPATVAGLRYTFVWAGTAGQTFNISPNSSDKIMGSILDVANGNIVTAASSGAGADNKDLQLDAGSQVGDRVTLVADGDNGWYIEQALGSWAFES